MKGGYFAIGPENYNGWKVHWQNYPTSGLLIAVVAGILFGVLVAIIPARQASRLQIFQALRYE